MPRLRLLSDVSSWNLHKYILYERLTEVYEKPYIQKNFSGQVLSRTRQKKTAGLKSRRQETVSDLICSFPVLV
jgi:hypothetical protein